MPNILNAEAIGALWDAHNRPFGKRNLSAGASLLRRIASDGWAMRADIEDIFYLYDSRLDGQADIKALAATLQYVATIKSAARETHQGTGRPGTIEWE